MHACGGGGVQEFNLTCACTRTVHQARWQFICRLRRDQFCARARVQARKTSSHGRGWKLKAHRTRAHHCLWVWLPPSDVVQVLQAPGWPRHAAGADVEILAARQLTSRVTVDSRDQLFIFTEWNEKRMPVCTKPARGSSGARAQVRTVLARRDETRSTRVPT